MALYRSISNYGDPDIQLLDGWLRIPTISNTGPTPSYDEIVRGWRGLSPQLTRDVYQGYSVGKLINIINQLMEKYEPKRENAMMQRLRSTAAVRTQTPSLLTFRANPAKGGSKKRSSRKSKTRKSHK